MKLASEKLINKYLRSHEADWNIKAVKEQEERRVLLASARPPPPKDAVNGPFYLFSVNHDSESPR